MIALVVADTCHTLVTRLPGLQSWGIRVHTIPVALATSIAATRARTSSCSSAWITSGSCIAAGLLTSPATGMGGMPEGLGREPKF
jgi:hypothetical protein